MRVSLMGIYSVPRALLSPDQDQLVQLSLFTRPKAVWVTTGFKYPWHHYKVVPLDLSTENQQLIGAGERLSAALTEITAPGAG